MLRLKRFNESQSTFPMDRDEVSRICVDLKIQDFSIEDDGTVNVNGSVYINQKMERLPIKFGEVTENFRASGLGLTTLEGLPHTIGGSLYLNRNKLTSLEGCPSRVPTDFQCDQNKLTTLEGGPSEVSFYRCLNNKLTSLKGAPKSVMTFLADTNRLRSLEFCPDTLDLSVNFNLLNSLEGCPQNVRSLHCNFNNLTSMEGAPEELHVLSCGNNLLTSMEGLPKKIRFTLHLQNNFYLVNPKGMEGFVMTGMGHNLLSSPHISIENTPLFSLMKQFKDLSQFIQSLDYYYFRMVDGVPSVIGFRLDEALEEFDLKRKPILNYRVVDENMKEIEPLVKEDFAD